MNAAWPPRSAAVVGGGSEIAEAILLALAAEGLESVALCGRRQSRLEQVGARLRARGVGCVVTRSCDVTDLGSLPQLAAELDGELGGIDLLLVAAGVLGPASIEKASVQAVGEVVAADLTGPVAAIVAFLPALRRRGAARIVVLSSVAAVRTRRANLLYASAKAGLDGFCQGLADSLATSGVEVCIVRPGFVRTAMTSGRRPQPLAVRPEDVGRAVVHGLRRHAAVVWAPPTMRAVAFGMRVAPRALWRRLRR